MNKQKLAANQVIIYAVGMVLLLTLIITTATVAGYELEPDIRWQVLSGGGAPAAYEPGSFVINGSLGQPISGSAWNDELKIGSGFWYGVSGKITYLYLPISMNH